MNTKQLYKAIDTCYSEKLEENRLSYNIRKVRNALQWKVNIGRFDKITALYWENYIDDYREDILGQFGEILEIAIKEVGK